ncbi:MAG TPA: glycosyltransferase family 39 protein [Dehalococcoidia bacterium]|nr:glycosyltransferase family 39 protein [Dehalococcoidia bacterium]
MTDRSSTSPSAAKERAARLPAIVPSPLPRLDTWIVAIFAVALILRLLWALEVECSPRAVWRWDMTLYDYQAHALAEGDGYIDYSGNPTAHWPPGYPAALAAVYHFTDDSLLGARLLNVVAGSLTVVLVYLLGARVFGRAAGLAGAALLAVFPNQVFYTSLVMTEPLFTALFVMILTLTAYAALGAKPPRLWHMVSIGALIGLASLVRGEALLLAPLVALALLLRWRSWRKVAEYSVVLVVGTVLIVAPWTARNVVRMKALIPISTSATEALWVGHHEGADGKIADFGVVGTAYAGLPNPELEVKTSNEALRQALTFMRSRPLDELQLVPKKFAALYKGDGSALRWMQLDTPTIRPSLADGLWALSNTFYRVVLVLALLGLPAWFSLRDSSKALLVTVVVAWTALFSIVFFGDERFHFSVIPIFCLWAGAALTTGGQFILREWRKRADKAAV